MEFANKIGVTVIENYIDRALPATSDNRPDFQRMIRDSNKHCLDMIIVWKLDRFSRDRYDSAHYKHILKKNGVKVVSAKENIGEGPEGIILESMLEGFEYSNGHNNKNRIEAANQCKIKDIAYNSYKRERPCLFLDLY